jgi:transcriptional regulator with XRE-family HTH domain
MTATAEATYPQEFARRMRAARDARGLTERDAAFAVGTGQSHIQQLERGVQPPLITTIYKLAAGLRVPPLWLAFGGTDDVPEPTEVEYDEAAVRHVFALRAKFARRVLDLMQREVGERLGIHQSNVSAIERGVQGATLDSLHGYVEALDLPPEWLMDTSPEVQPWEA